MGSGDVGSMLALSKRQGLFDYVHILCFLFLECTYSIT